MLDQNTDRMWYVIGAVLVGAAIILIANGTLPQMFASITNSFEDTSNSAMSGVNDIVTHKEVSRVFTLADMQSWMEGQVEEGVPGNENAVILSPNSQFAAGLFFTPNSYKKGVTYSLEFDITKLEGDIKGIGGHLTVSDKVDVKIDGKRAPMWEGYLPQTNPDLTIPRDNEWTYARQYPNDHKKRHVEVIFTVGENIWGSDTNVYIQPNRAGDEFDYEHNGLYYKALIENVVLYEYVETEG